LLQMAGGGGGRGHVFADFKKGYDCGALWRNREKRSTNFAF
jgi:hypothetical protein